MCRRPPSTFHLEVTRRRQREPLQLRNQSPLALYPIVFETIHALTLSHKIFQMVPLDVVRQVTDVDTTVLLGRVANGVQHLLFGDGALLK